MNRYYTLLWIIGAIVAPASPSSIDGFELPSPPPERFGLEKVEKAAPDAEIWYTLYHRYLRDGQETRHGLWIERTRSRDRTQFDTDYVEIRKIYYDGAPSTHHVTSTWIDGVLRDRVYALREGLEIHLQFTPDGRVVQGPRANARGGRAKQERITELFDQIYQLNTP